MSLLERKLDGTEDIWNPPRERSMVDTLADREVHVSELVRDTAVAMHLRLFEPNAMGHNAEPQDNYYGWKGDTLGWGMSPDFPHGEMVVEYPLGETGWKMVGAVDAVDWDDDHVVFGEWKGYSYITESKVESAFRQVNLYLAMWWRAYRDGQRTWAITPDGVQSQINLFERMGIDREPVREITFPDGLAPGGTVLRVAPVVHLERKAVAWQLGNDELDELLAYFEEKALAFVDSVESEDPYSARTFDMHHADEKYVQFDDIGKPPREVLADLIELSDERVITKASDERQTKLKAELAKSFIAGKLIPGKNWVDEGSGFYAVVREPKGKSIFPIIRFYGERAVKSDVDDGG